MGFYCSDIDSLFPVRRTYEILSVCSSTLHRVISRGTERYSVIIIHLKPVIGYAFIGTSLIFPNMVLGLCSLCSILESSSLFSWLDTAEFQQVFWSSLQEIISTSWGKNVVRFCGKIVEEFLLITSICIPTTKITKKEFPTLDSLNQVYCSSHPSEERNVK